MSAALAIALAQINPTVGDVKGNLGRIREARAEAAGQGADLVVFPELCLAGYPPEDLVLKPAFLDACSAAVEQLAARHRRWRPGDARRRALASRAGCPTTPPCCSMAAASPASATSRTCRITACSTRSASSRSASRRGRWCSAASRLGVMICEDMWKPEVGEMLAETGAEILIVPNGSPFEARQARPAPRPRRRARASRRGLPLIYVNQVGGQDELVFDGGSFVLNADRALALQLPAFREARRRHALAARRRRRLALRRRARSRSRSTALRRSTARWCSGLGDYVRKNRFPGVVLGLSGGIDSALTAAIAVDALGADRVRA